jgi:hypothetical protein
LKKQLGVLSVMTLLVVTLFTLSAFATDAQMYFSSDKNGQNRVTNIQEGDEIWIVVIDNDQNIDCDTRDKMSPDLKIMDPKTGAYIVWNKVADFDPAHPEADYLEETGADTGVFTSVRAFQVGSRENYDVEREHAHVVDVPAVGDGLTNDFQWGNFIYMDEADAGGFADDRVWVQAGTPVFNNAAGFALPGLVAAADNPSEWAVATKDFTGSYLIGRFENMDTLVGMYQDPNDATDVAIGLMKIIDTEASISWDQQIYKDANGSASITVIDPDENLNCNEVEWVPVTVLVNPGSWNQSGDVTVNSFCSFLQDGGYDSAGVRFDSTGAQPIRWYNIYEERYIEYPTAQDSTDDDNVNWFDTIDTDGLVKVTFYAQETGVSTGVFQLNFNQILGDLGFNDLYVRDVLVAYYLDPNDADDFKLATAYIEEKQHSITSFTDENRADKDLFWIGRDPVYVQVIDANANVDPCCPEQVIVHICDPHGEDDAEWLMLDETSSNSPVFFTFSGTQLWPVWDALGVGIAGPKGGFQLQVDNWKIEAFNEDDIYARYNDVYYATDSTGLAGLGDTLTTTAFPPVISRIRVANDVSFDLMSVADTQVYDGSSVNMFFLDRQGNRVSGYVNSDCVFIEVVDNDQDEDQYRRERIDAYWDGGQNFPFGPIDEYTWECGPKPPAQTPVGHPVNTLLGHVTIFNENIAPKVYVLNPRSGHWASVDLLETGVATGDFVSVICIDLMSVYECVPQLGVLPGDTLVAFYQDPSNHSDSAMISIKVGIGGGGTPPSQQSTTMFVDAEGNEVANYTDADTVYVKVIDPSHAGATLLASAVEIDGVEYDVTPLGAADSFITAALDLGLVAGDEVVATYVDPTDLTDTSADTITVIASVLAIDSFYAGPNPFEGEVTFGFNGTGIASTMSVAIYNLAGGVVYETTLTDVSEITWDGAGLANGAYIYVITATDGTNTFSDTGKVFINR